MLHSCHCNTHTGCTYVCIRRHLTNNLLHGRQTIVQTVEVIRKVRLFVNVTEKYILIDTKIKSLSALLFVCCLALVFWVTEDV